MILTIGMFGLAIWIGHIAHVKTNRTLVGWLSGILAWVALIIVFLPTMDAIDYARCKGERDYQACIDDDYDDGY